MLIGLRVQNKFMNTLKGLFSLKKKKKKKVLVFNCYRAIIYFPPGCGTCHHLL